MIYQRAYMVGHVKKTKGLIRGQQVIQEQKWFLKHLFRINSLPGGYDILYLFKDFHNVFYAKCRYKQLLLLEI